MGEKVQKIDVFQPPSLNIAHELKRAMKVALANSRFSRDQISDEMNKLADLEGVKGRVSKAVLDGWLKTSDLSRLPSLPWLVIFCKTLNSVFPLQPIASALDSEIINSEQILLLRWAEAELAKRRAVKKAERAFSLLQDEGL